MSTIDNDVADAMVVLTLVLLVVLVQLQGVVVPELTNYHIQQTRPHQVHWRPMLCPIRSCSFSTAPDPDSSEEAVSAGQGGEPVLAAAGREPPARPALWEARVRGQAAHQALGHVGGRVRACRARHRHPHGVRDKIFTSTNVPLVVAPGHVSPPLLPPAPLACR